MVTPSIVKQTVVVCTWAVLYIFPESWNTYDHYKLEFGQSGGGGGKQMFSSLSYFLGGSFFLFFLAF